MKKNILKKVALGSLVAVCCTGIFTACGKDDNPETPSTNYTLVFDEDNNAATDNITKVVAKNALNDKTNWPTLADENGYARQWVLKGWNKDTATLIASTSDGSQTKPYLISTEAHFKKMADSVSALTQAETTTYYQGNTEVESTQTYDKVVKESSYNTVAVTSTEQSGVKTWTYETSKQYFRLISDVVFDTQVITATGYSSFVLDGTKLNTFTNEAEGNYKLTNVGLENFPNGYMFNVLVDATIQNLDVTLVSDIVQLAFYTSGGVYNDGETRRDTTNFTNITIDSNGAPINQQGTNKSAFISHVMHDASFNMTNCTNDITKINSSSGYCGVFVGGYPKTDGKVTFTNCTNNADITTTGAIGIFFGNDTYKANTIAQNIHEIINCKNTGTIIGNARSHVLVPFENTGNQTATRFNETETSVLDGGVDGKFTNAEGGSFTAIAFKQAEISGNNIVLPSELLSTLEDGKTYTIVVNVENALHKYESSLDNRFYSSFSTNIPLTYTLTVEGSVTTDFVMQDIYCALTDVTQYCEKYSVDSETIVWVDGGTCQYYLDTVNHCYVINTTEYEGIMKTETTNGNNVRYSVVIKDGDNIVEYFAVTPKENELQ